MGESGTGKSSIGNCLLGLNSSEGFKVSRRADSCTKETKEISGTWVTTGTDCAIIDTPGLNDSDNEDTEHIRGIGEFLRHRGWVDSFLLVRNSRNPMMNHSFIPMLATFELTFGKDFWHHVSIVVSSLSGYSDDPDEQLSIERWARKIRELFPNSAKAPLETVVLDVKRKDPDKDTDNAEKLWRLISATESFDWKDMIAVMSELDQKNKLITNLNEKLARLENLMMPVDVLEKTEVAVQEQYPAMHSQITRVFKCDTVSEALKKSAGVVQTALLVTLAILLPNMRLREELQGLTSTPLHYGNILEYGSLWSEVQHQ